MEQASQALSLKKQSAFFFKPESIEDAWRLSTIISKSDFAPRDFKGKPENTFLAIQLGGEIGLSPMQSVQNIAVINGRPCVWGDAALALVYGCGLLERIDERFEGEGEMKEAVCFVKRKGMQVVERRFSVMDARLAGLWEKAGPWKQYPERMLQMRARGFALRDAFPDVLKGLNFAEEVSDYTDQKDVITVNAEASKAETVKAENVEVKDLTKKEAFFIKKSPKDGKNYLTIQEDTNVFNPVALERMGFLKKNGIWFVEYSQDIEEQLLSIVAMKEAVSDVTGSRANLKNESQEVVEGDMHIEHEMDREEGLL